MLAIAAGKHYALDVGSETDPQIDVIAMRDLTRSVVAARGS